MNNKNLALALTLALPLTVSAFPGGNCDFHGQRGDRMERLSKKLNLTEEQSGQLEAIFKEQREKFKAVHEETRARMREILTEEQMAKMDEMKKRRQEKWQNRKAPVQPE
ncbi:MAG: periplasmic heavy metal sensor [Gammaproteobacteria bacterium]